MDLRVTYYDKRRNIKNRCKLDNAHPYFEIIRQHFSYDNPSSVFSSNDNLPDRKYSIAKTGMMDVGLLWEVKKFIRRNEWEFKLDLCPKTKKRLICPITFPICEVPNETYKLRDYQRTAIENAFKVGHGIEEVGTGGGKSLILASMMESIHQGDRGAKMLLVVPDTGLVSQMFNDFTEYECSFSFSKWMGGFDLDETTDVVIVHAKFLHRFGSKEKKRYEKFFSNIKYLFHDEVHEFYIKSISKATDLLKSFEYEHKFGFTGSLHKPSYARNVITGFFGMPVYVKTSKELRDEEYLTSVEVKMIEFNHNDAYMLYNPRRTASPTENYVKENDYIYESEFRNGYIKKIVSKIKGNALILVEKIAQGEILEQVLSEVEGREVYFIQGKTKIAERERIKQLMEKNDNIICIAMSTIFSKGISIKNIPFLIFASLGKTWYKTIQSIGRGLRLHERKEKLIIFDLYDNLWYSEEHANERKRIYVDQAVEYKICTIYE